ncbi:MAG: twin-arginine translocation signal domain-containing protein, partial [Gemmatimonadales bacterium]
MGNHRRQFLKESALGVAATAGLASAVSSARAQEIGR